MIRPITFDEQIARAKDDGGVYRSIYPHDGILWGCAVTTTSTQIEIASGLFTLCGRMIWVDGKTDFPLQEPIQNGYAQLKAKIDLNNANTQEECAQFSAEVLYSTTTSFPELIQEDINNTGKKYEQEMAVVKIENGNITGITRKLADAGVDAEKLGGKLPAYYGTAAGVQAAQNTANEAQNTANAAMPKTGGTFSGNIVFNGDRNIYPLTDGLCNLGGGAYKWRKVQANVMHADQYRFNATGTGRIVSNSNILYLLANNAVLCQKMDASGDASGWADLNAGIISAMEHVRSKSAADWLILRGSAVTCYAFGANTLVPCNASNITGSSERYKENIREMTEEEADRLLDAVAVAFDWKEGSGWVGESMSFIAERLAEIDERFVYRNSEGQVDGILANPIMAALQMIVKRHDREMNALKSENDALLALLVEKGVLTQKEIDGLDEEYMEERIMSIPSTSE